MNTTEKGNSLEAQVHDLFRGIIDREEFWARSALCNLRKKPRYFSKLRDSNIEFDLSIEIGEPQNPALICPIECKNYNHRVPVDDVEEFIFKLEQVSAHKGILVSTGGFQKGAFSVAKNKRLGLMRYFGGVSHKWELRRSTAAALNPTSALQKLILEGALEDEAFDPLALDAVFETPNGPTLSLWTLFDDLITDDEISKLAFAQSFPDERHGVPYVSDIKIEKLAGELRSRCGIDDIPVNIDVVSKFASAQSGFDVCIMQEGEGVVPPSILGRILFEDRKIELFPMHARHHQNLRFTWAHELGHWCLGHEQYLLTDTFEADDADVGVPALLKNTDISRLEHQANRFASALLMPKRSFLHRVILLLKENDVHDKGHGLLYVDSQPANLKTFNRVCGSLAEAFDVSFGAVAVRLEQLGVLNDCRIQKPSAKSVNEIQERDADLGNNEEWHDDF